MKNKKNTYLLYSHQWVEYISEHVNIFMCGAMVALR